MTVFTAHWPWAAVICIAVITLSPQDVDSQIPVACSDAESLGTQTCCPNGCGATDQRGACVDIQLPSTYSMTSTDVRGNWPHYFTRACRCNGNFGEYDCSRCKYGYYGTNCNQKQVLPRRSIQELNDQEWSDYIEILKMTRNYSSGYKVVLREDPPGTTDIMAVNIDLYDFFVWLHHYAAKDSECGGICLYN